jgi:crotonobetainyl-CoA:carnitine CoA-transferase CaiB-like acyl-CoA transferase
MTGNIPQRLGSLHPNIAPYGEQFETQDNNWIVLAIGSDEQFRKLCIVLQTPEIADDTAFASNTLRVQNRVQLQELLQQQFKQC